MDLDMDLNRAEWVQRIHIAHLTYLGLRHSWLIDSCSIMSWHAELIRRSYTDLSSRGQENRTLFHFTIILYDCKMFYFLIKGLLAILYLISGGQVAIEYIVSLTISYQMLLRSFHLIVIFQRVMSKRLFLRQMDTNLT